MDTVDSTSSMEEELDSEISTIRAEIRNLQRRKRFLSSSILASEAIQKRLGSTQSSLPQNPLFTLDDDISPLVRTAGKHVQSNHHRIAFSATAFPFKDPAPQINDSSDSNDPNNLLGIRIDVCARNGRFSKPYYLLLKRVRSDSDGGSGKHQKRVRVYRHTIPAFIPVERLERIYLPHVTSDVLASPEGPDEGDKMKSSSSVSTTKRRRTSGDRKQDLTGLVREIRRRLVSWHYRVDAVNLLREQLGIVRQGLAVGGEVETEAENEDWNGGGLAEHSSPAESRQAKNDLGIVALAPTALDAAYIRLEWEDGRVGRLKISNSGVIERAVVIGDTGRDKVIEAAITGGDRKVITVLDRLRKQSMG